MYSNNKLIILFNFDSLYNYLRKNIIYNEYDFYNEKILIKHEINENNNKIRIWKSNVLLNYWYDDLTDKNFLAGLNYKINEDNIKINFINVNDKHLSEIKKTLLTNSLLEYTKNLAKEKNKKKIIIDVYHNLRMYNRNYYYDDFIVTKRRYYNNSFCLEAEYNF